MCSRRLYRTIRQLSLHLNGDSVASPSQVDFTLFSQGSSHANGIANGIWGDREPAHGDDHSLAYSNYANPADCGHLLMNNTVANPTALGK